MSTGIVVGNPRSASRTFGAAMVVIRELTGRDPDFALDLAEFGPKLLDWSDPDITVAVDLVKSARLVVVASPTYKATYTGLLKLFLDRFAAGSLAGVVAVPLQLGGDWRHALAPEVFLKPVLAEIGASTPTHALYLLDTDAGEDPDVGFAGSPTLREWLAVARPQLATVLSEESTRS
jgi:FMN reductase